MKKLSIIVPCYKVEQYLPRCLDSLVNQTLQDLEIICINDGSPDNCLAILKKYKSLYPDKIIIIDKPNEGVWIGRRDGIALATGEYIGFLDSDDYALPNFAESLYQAAKENDADIAVGGFNRVDLENDGILTTEMVSERPSFMISEDPGRLLELNGAPWNKIFRADLLKNLPDLEHKPKILDDLIFHLLVYISAEGRVVFVPKPLVHYMIRGDSIITTIRKDKIDSTFAAFDEVGTLYSSSSCSMAKRYMLASAAFLHLGISLLFRLMYDKTCDLKQYLITLQHFLDADFPDWSCSPYLKLPYALRNKGAFMKLWIVRMAYRLHLVLPFMAIYRFFVDKLGIDIKW